MDTLKCIWMEAGAVDYQLCPLKQNCDQCDFHTEMIKGSCTITSDTRALNFQLCYPTISLVHFTPGLQYIKGHFWFKRVAADRIRVGIDSYLWQLFSSLQSVIIPKDQTILPPHQCLAWLTMESGIIYLKTPIPGRIQKSNPLFQSQNLRDAHVYLCPDHELWFAELEAFDLSNMIPLHKDGYFTTLENDFDLLKKLIPTTEPKTGIYGKSSIKKNAFSAYLQCISDNNAIVC